jgi:hypothetical protein
LVPVHWVTDPFPEWRTDKELGFIDQAFTGWYDTRNSGRSVRVS